MSIPIRIIFFGACSGLVWSLAPGIFAGLYSNPHIPLPLVFVACVIVGILVSFLLALPLLKANHWVTLLLGVFALPVGAFCFGLFFGLFASSHENPFKIGLTFALWSVLYPLYGIALIPCAVLNTFLLQKCLLMPK